MHGRAQRRDCRIAVGAAILRPIRCETPEADIIVALLAAVQYRALRDNRLALVTAEAWPFRRPGFELVALGTVSLGVKPALPDAASLKQSRVLDDGRATSVVRS